MSISLSEVAVPTFTAGLNTLLAIIDKASSHAQDKGLDPHDLLDARLCPDMFSFTRQIQAASDTARRGIDRVVGVEPASVADNESSFDELRTRVKNSLAHVGQVDRAAVDASEDRKFSVPLGKEAKLDCTGRSYLLGFALPNFLFHVTTAYDILRHHGVELGKRDFLTSFVEANSGSSSSN